MKPFSRNIVLFSRDEFMSEQAIEKEVAYLNGILAIADTPEAFCNANELVDRNSITSNPRKILKECRHFLLREFRFLINKN